MVISALFDLQKELNRIFSAGSKFAKDDPRLQRFVPVLEKIGEKAPIINVLAQQLNALVAAAPQEAAGKLLEFSSLLYSVLHILTDASVKEPTEPILQNIQPIDVKNIPFSQVKRIKHMLLGKEKFNEAFMLDAFKKGVFEDFRLTSVILQSLNSTNYYMANFMATDIIPHLDQKMVPQIAKNISIQDNKVAEALKLTLIYTMDPDFDRALLYDVMENGEEKLVLAAIPFLGINAQEEEILLKCAKGKKQEIAGASLVALVRHQWASGIQRALQIWNTKKYKGALEALTLATDPTLFDTLLPVLENAYTKAMQKAEDDVTKKEVAWHLQFIEDSFGVLQHKQHDAESYEFYKKALLHLLPKISVGYEQRNFLLGVANVVASFSDVHFIEDLVQQRSLLKIDSDILRLLFNRVRDLYPPEQLFTLFEDGAKESVITPQLFLDHTVDTDTRNLDEKTLYDSISIDAIDQRFLPLFLQGLVKNNDSYYYSKAIACLLLKLLDRGQWAEEEDLYRALIAHKKSNGNWDLILNIGLALIQRENRKGIMLFWDSLKNKPNYYRSELADKLDQDDYIQHLTLEDADKLEDLGKKSSILQFNDIALKIRKGASK